MKNLGDGQSPTEAIAEAKAGFVSAPCQHKRAKPVQVRERSPAGGEAKGDKGTGCSLNTYRTLYVVHNLHPVSIRLTPGYPDQPMEPERCNPGAAFSGTPLVRAPRHRIFGPTQGFALRRLLLAAGQP